LVERRLCKPEAAGSNPAGSIVPSENVQTLKRIYESWRQGDFSAAIPAFSSDVVLVMDSELPDSGTYEGLEGIRDYTRSFLDPWESLTIDAESFQQSGDRIMVGVLQTGVGRDSGVPVEFRYFHVWTFSEGSVVRLESIKSEDKARESLRD
jgi:ketosteroid isomerase-like protein